MRYEEKEKLIEEKINTEIYEDSVIQASEESSEEES